MNINFERVIRLVVNKLMLALYAMELTYKPNSVRVECDYRIFFLTWNDDGFFEIIDETKRCSDNSDFVYNIQVNDDDDDKIAARKIFKFLKTTFEIPVANH